MLHRGLNPSPLKSFANDFVLPPSGRIAANSRGNGYEGLDSQIRGMRPPGYRGSQANNAFNVNSAANLSQETGFGHMTNIGSNLNFGIRPMGGDSENYKASIDINELNALLNLSGDDPDGFEKKTGRANY